MKDEKSTGKSAHDRCYELEQWMKNEYIPWYQRNTGVQAEDGDSSNPGGDPPPKPPGFQP